ncbi:uncharacterized protein M6B38_283405 [Iris pallida]|uniref:Uncharacterized protein n=1 Tax=Iris pallida TaxID=29817 RepID=A0AAX6I229_IRIPA|nr:uncharacterized protein M6B38_283405 [Iris pallida]
MRGPAMRLSTCREEEGEGRGRGRRRRGAGGEVEALRQLRQRGLLRLRRHRHTHLHVPRHGHLREVPPPQSPLPLLLRRRPPPPPRRRRREEGRPRGPAPELLGQARLSFPKMSIYAKGVSVLMPGNDIPTFIAHPAPVPCPPERISWPPHQNIPIGGSSSVSS